MVPLAAAGQPGVIPLLALVLWALVNHVTGAASGVGITVGVNRVPGESSAGDLPLI